MSVPLLSGWLKIDGSCGFFHAFLQVSGRFFARFRAFFFGFSGQKSLRRTFLDLKTEKNRRERHGKGMKKLFLCFFFPARTLLGSAIVPWAAAEPKRLAKRAENTRKMAILTRFLRFWGAFWVILHIKK
jgi:hypothetical protein